MKTRTIFRFIAVVYLAMAVFSVTEAQTFAFFRNGVQVANNSEITITDFTVEDGAVVLESGLEVHNLAPLQLRGVVNQHVVQAPDKGTISFCFGNCVLTNLDLSLEWDVDPGNLTALHVYLATAENDFTSTKVEYTVSPKMDNTDQQKVIVNFVYALNGISPVNMNGKAFVIVRDNGKSGFQYNFNSEKNRKIQLYNLTGQIIASNQISKRSGTWIPDRSLTKGIYLIAVKENNQTVLSQKVIIR